MDICEKIQLSAVLATVIPTTSQEKRNVTLSENLPLKPSAFVDPHYKPDTLGIIWEWPHHYVSTCMVSYIDSW